MKIVWNPQMRQQREVGTLHWKDTFTYDGHIYMRLGWSNTPRTQRMNNTAQVAVVNLKSGDLRMFSRGTMVVPVEAEVHVIHYRTDEL
jgi:hypothetical protein